MTAKKITTIIYSFFLLLTTTFIHAQSAEIAKLQKNLPKITDSIIYVNKLNRIAMLLQMKSPDSCLIYGYKARNIATRKDYSQGIADANNVMAIAFAVKGMQYDAVKYFKKALSGYKQLKDTSNIVQVYMNMSILFSSLEDKKNMVNYSKKAMKLGQKIPNDSILSIVYSNYVISNPNIAADSVKYYRDKSNFIASKFNDTKVVLINRLNEVDKLILEKDKKTLLPILNEILAESHKLGLDYVELNALGTLSNLYYDEPNIAVQYSEDAFAAASAGGYSYLQPLILQQILHYAELTGDTAKQLETSKKLVNAVAIQQQQLQLFFGDYMRLNEIQEKNSSLEKQSKANNKYIMLLCIFLLISLVFVFITVRLYKKSQRISRKKSALNRAIRRKNQMLKEADHFKNRLVSILAHDFRSPIISTLSLVEILSSNPDLSDDEMDELYGIIKTDVSTILDKFDITLQWILQQLSGYKLNIVQLRISGLIDDVIHNFAIEAQKKQVQIVNIIPAEASIMSDKEMLQFINRNLISNAIKFSPIGGKITVDIKQESNNWIISVADQGKGVDANKRDNLFSAADLVGSTKDGAGIALSMCSDFIIKLGGEINQENNADGGATFFYKLPVSVE